MKLEDVRQIIDTIDPEIREILMKRMDCSYQVVKAKIESGDLNIYRADREEEILSKLGEGVPVDRKAAYLSIVRKIMETSRMYQYGLMYDWVEGALDSYLEGVDIKEEGTHVCVRVTRENRPNAMSSILSMIGDYGFNMDRMNLIADNKEANTVTFDLVVLGDLNEISMKKLLFQLSKECIDFKIIDNY